MSDDFHALAEVIRQDWRDDALCPQVSIDEFHVEQGIGSTEQINFAKQICGLCPVQAECLDYALAANEQIGVWGGTTPKARQRLRAERGITSNLPKPEFASWHGTAAGARRHWRNGTKVCDECREAERRHRRGLAS